MPAENEPRKVIVSNVEFLELCLGALNTGETKLLRRTLETTLENEKERRSHESDRNT